VRVEGVFEAARESVDERADALERIRIRGLAPGRQVRDRVAGGVHAEEAADREGDRLGHELLARVAQLRVLIPMVEVDERVRELVK
jgi:hypothetical protein